MNLYVWANPYEVPYGGSTLFVVADSAEEAKLMARSSKASAFSFGKFKEDKLPYDGSLGDPTRVVPIPCAEWHEWSE